MRERRVSIVSLCRELGIDPEFGKRLFAHILYHLQLGDEVRIKNFGKFYPRVVPRKTAINPRTGEKFVSEPRLTIGFRTSKNAINTLTNGGKR